MKKFLAAICAAALIMTGCGGEQSADKPVDSSSGKVIQLGMLAPLNYRRCADD